MDGGMDGGMDGHGANADDVGGLGRAQDSILEQASGD
jgi:hypothetical protein